VDHEKIALNPIMDEMLHPLQSIQCTQHVIRHDRKMLQIRNLSVSQTTSLFISVLNLESAITSLACCNNFVDVYKKRI
jgi:selenophosphate synthase